MSATAAADPDEEPPGVHSRLFGFFVFPGADRANSVVTHLPNIMISFSRNNFTRWASSLGFLPTQVFEPFSVGKSLVSIMSFIPIGIPAKGFCKFFDLFSSIFFAWDLTKSSFKKAHASTFGSLNFMWLINSETYSTALIYWS